MSQPSRPLGLVHGSVSGACLNCDTALRGGWCYHCGQRAEAHHRSLRHVLFEVVEILTHADSRLWRTMRGLVLRPAPLTRDYVEGRRAAQIPPLRLFFIMLLLFFGLGSFGQHNHLEPLPLDSATLAQALHKVHLSGRIAAWAQAHIMRAATDPRGFLDVVSAWAERFAFLMLPIAALLLGLLFIGNRRQTMYDHVIFSLHSLSFCLLILTLMAVPLLDVAGALLLLLLPLHLFVHMRGFYRIGTFATLLRMAALGLGSSLGIAILVGGLALLGLQLSQG